MQVGRRADLVRLCGSTLFCRPLQLVQDRLDLFGHRCIAVIGRKLIRLLRQGQALPRPAHSPEYQ